MENNDVVSLDVSYEELLIEMSGEDVNEWKRHKKIIQKLEVVADALLDLPIDQWPEININWDLSKESMRFALDGLSASKFRQSYPDVLIVRWVELDKLNNVLCSFNKRSVEETWNVGFKDKLARVIAWVSDGNPLTPIYISINEALGDKLKLEGGNHRYAMLNAKKISPIPVLLRKSEESIISSIIKLSVDEKMNALQSKDLGNG